MTDSQYLLAEYLESGSNAAFRELVIRDVDLVYSTALRLCEPFEWPTRLVRVHRAPFGNHSCTNSNEGTLTSSVTLAQSC
jgi:hypothetical protein